MMAFASEDLWSKFDLSLDKMSSLRATADSCWPPGRSILLVNNGGRPGRQRCDTTASSLLAAEATSPLGASLVPDIRDLISGSGDLGGGCLEDLADLNMDGGIDMEFDESLLLGDGLLDGDETDPLRHDCMWSGGSGTAVDMRPPVAEQQPPQPACGSFSSSYFGDQLLLELGEGQQLLLGTSPTSTSSNFISNTDAAATRTETSDLEETSSDLEEETAAVRMSSSFPAHSDHSYIATPTSGSASYLMTDINGRKRENRSNNRAFSAGHILTPEASSSSSSDDDEEEEDDDRCAWPKSKADMIKTNDCIENKATFRVPVLPAASRLHRRTGTLQSCFAAENSAVTSGSSATAAKSSKFRFHIKFKPKSMAAALGPRSVLRCHPPTRTCYTRRRNCPTDAAAQLIKHAFFPVSSTPRRQQPSLQVRGDVSSVSEPDPDPVGSGIICRIRIRISDPEPERIRNLIFANKLNFLPNNNVYLW